MAVYYNENDEKAAAWLRELIKGGHIPDGEIDTRSIRDVRPSDLGGFTECHFFAGIGVWAHALRNAQFPSGKIIWTGSCPCQPFSAAGKGDGFDDERHLWPDWLWLIRQCRPDLVLGEQVAQGHGYAWLDLVSHDLEGEGYAFGASDTPACGFGAPQKRNRLYFVGMADRERARSQGYARYGDDETGWEPGQARSIAEGGVSGTMADASEQRRQRGRASQEGDQSRTLGRFERLRDAGILANANGDGFKSRGLSVRTRRSQQATLEQLGAIEKTENLGPVNGYWRDADWLRCRDDKWRAVRPGAFPLVNGCAGRVALLRGAGNALVAPQATAFCEIVKEIAYGD